VRSGRTIPGAARALAAAGVPVRTTGGELALGERFGARHLLAVLELALDPSSLTAAKLAEALTGPLGGVDALGLRRLRLALRAEELAGGGSRSADELLVDAMRAPGRLATIELRAARRAEHFATTLE